MILYNTLYNVIWQGVFKKLVYSKNWQIARNQGFSRV